jgi:hypothetical protein
VDPFGTISETLKIKKGCGASMWRCVWLRKSVVFSTS